jgi:hypothetical protein
MFASPLFAELIEHPERPSLILPAVAWLGNLVLIVGCVWGYQRLTTKRRGDIAALVLAFVAATAFLVGSVAILAPDYLVAFKRAAHPHWPWTRP